MLNLCNLAFENFIVPIPDRGKVHARNGLNGHRHLMFSVGGFRFVLNQEYIQYRHCQREKIAEVWLVKFSPLDFFGMIFAMAVDHASPPMGGYSPPRQWGVFLFSPNRGDGGRGGGGGLKTISHPI